jgi:hypothetical protein
VKQKRAGGLAQVVEYTLNKRKKCDFLKKYIVVSAWLDWSVEHETLKKYVV